MWGTFVRGFVDLEPASSCEHMSEINSMRQLSHCTRNSGDNKHSKGACERDREKERGSEKKTRDDETLQTPQPQANTDTTFPQHGGLRKPHA